ncbi:MAG: hypothetical protein AAF211_05990, partial [Myxococcota bacterium]
MVDDHGSDPDLGRLVGEVRAAAGHRVGLGEQTDGAAILVDDHEGVLGGVDERFERFVEARIADLAIEPRWDPRRVRLLQVRLDDVPPEDAEARTRWADDWLTVAYGSWQEGRNVDAERALQVVRAAGEEPPRFLFLQGEMALTA